MWNRENKIILLKPRVCDKIKTAHTLTFLKNNKNFKAPLLGGENDGRGEYGKL